MTRSRIVNWKPRFTLDNDTALFVLESWTTNKFTHGVAPSTNNLPYNPASSAAVGNKSPPYIEFRFAVTHGYKLSIANMLWQMQHDDLRLHFVMRSSVDGYKNNVFVKTGWPAPEQTDLTVQNSTPRMLTYTNSLNVRNVTHSTFHLRLYGTEAQNGGVFMYAMRLGWTGGGTVTNTAYTGPYGNQMLVFEGNLSRMGNTFPNTGPYGGGMIVTLTNVPAPALGNGSDLTNIVIGTGAQTVSTTTILGQGTNWVSWVMPPAGSMPPGVPQDIQVNSTSLGSTDFTEEYAYSSDQTLWATAGACGRLTPTGAVVVPWGGATSFVAQADAFYQVASLLTNGVAVSAASGQTAYTLVWDRVTTTGTLAVTFSEILATNRTPVWWLHRQGWTNDYDAAALADPDGDGAATWQEYVTGTNPRQSNSVLRSGLSSSASNQQVRFAAVSNKSYTVQFKENLDLGKWTKIAHVPAQPTDRVEIVVDPYPMTLDRLYRVVVPQLPDGPPEPVVLQSPRSLTVGFGDPARFTVIALGQGPGSYQWRRNGTPLEAATGSALQFTHISVADAGYYSVVVTDGVGSLTTDAARLGVRPAITAPPADQSTMAGQTATFRVTAIGAPPLRYQWLFNDQGLLGESNTVLTLENVQETHRGRYSVTVSHDTPAGTESTASDAHLDVMPIR